MHLQPPPGFPTCDPQQVGETIPEYAARVLRFLLACQTTASLTDEQIELADKAACTAIAQVRGPDGRASTACDDPATERILCVLSAARSTAQSALEWRRQQHRHAAQLEPHAPTGGKQPGRPAPLQPTPPDLDPAGATVHPFTRSKADGIRF